MLPIIDIETRSKIAIISKIYNLNATEPEKSGQRDYRFFIMRGVLMAQKRMFNKSITNSSRFLMMPLGTQALYFHLGMNADDDGFCEHFTIMRMTESKPDDLKILQAKGFVHVFDERVLVIRDWHENNYLRSDRYNQSKYLEMYKSEIDSLNECLPVGIPDVNQWDTQIRLDKISIDKNSKDKISKDNPASGDTKAGKTRKLTDEQITHRNAIIDLIKNKYKENTKNGDEYNIDGREGRAIKDLIKFPMKDIERKLKELVYRSKDKPEYFWISASCLMSNWNKLSEVKDRYDN